MDHQSNRVGHQKKLGCSEGISVLQFCSNYGSHGLCLMEFGQVFSDFSQGIFSEDESLLSSSPLLIELYTFKYIEIDLRCIIWITK